MDGKGVHSGKVRRTREWKIELGKVAAAMQDRGMAANEITAIFSQAGTGIAGRTVRRWVRRARMGLPAVSNEPPPGLAPILSREERTLVTGFVLDNNSRMEEVHGETVREFVRDHLGHEIGNQTALDYLHRLGFTDRAERAKPSGFRLDYEELAEMAFDWLKRHTFEKGRRRLCSIDFIFTSHRTDRPRTFAPRGSPQPKITKGYTRFTNCVVTCVWADGKNRTPPVLFTYNPAFRRQQRGGQRQRTKEAHFDEVLERYGICGDRVVYFGKEVNETRTYVPESPEALRHFIGQYRIPSKSTVLSDDGNAFFSNSVDVLRDLGFKRHLVYPPAVHMFLSPNDNGLHGPARKAWRHLSIDHKDDVESSIALLAQLDRFIGDSKRYFYRNLILRKIPVTLGLARDLVFPANFESNGMVACLREYRLWAGLPLREVEEGVPVGLDSSLDGPRWQ